MRLGATSAIVSVVIPCLDEEEPIAGVVREVLEQGVDEVIVVDNGSRDATAARARAAGARVVAEPRRGYGRACAAGVAGVRADAEIICFLDGDGSDVPQFLAAIVGPVARGEEDFVMGSRLSGRREPRQHDAAAARGRAGWRGRSCASSTACASPTCRRFAPCASISCAGLA